MECKLCSSFIEFIADAILDDYGCPVESGWICLDCAKRLRKEKKKQRKNAASQPAREPVSFPSPSSPGGAGGLAPREDGDFITDKPLQCDSCDSPISTCGKLSYAMRVTATISMQWLCPDCLKKTGRTPVCTVYAQSQKDGCIKCG